MNRSSRGWRSGAPALCVAIASASGAGQPSGASRANRVLSVNHDAMVAGMEVSSEPSMTASMRSLPPPSVARARPTRAGCVAQSIPMRVWFMVASLKGTCVPEEREALGRGLAQQKADDRSHLWAHCSSNRFPEGDTQCLQAAPRVVEFVPSIPSKPTQARDTFTPHPSESASLVHHAREGQAQGGVRGGYAALLRRGCLDGLGTHAKCARARCTPKLVRWCRRG